MEREFLELMPHTITVERRTGQDVYNRPAYDPVKKTYRCRIVGKGLSLRKNLSEDDTVIFDIYADMGNDVIKNEDKITLPDDAAWIDQTPVIFSVGRFTDENGHHHTKIQCGWMYHRQGQ